MAKHKESEGNGSANVYQLEGGRTNRVESHLGTVKVNGASGSQIFKGGEVSVKGNVSQGNLQVTIVKPSAIQDEKYQKPSNPYGWRYFNRRPVPLPACEDAVNEAKMFVDANGQRIIADNELPTIPSTKEELFAELSRYYDQLEAFDNASQIVSESGGSPVNKPYRVCTDNSGKPTTVASFLLQKVVDAVRLHVQKSSQVNMRAKAEVELRSEYDIAEKTGIRKQKVTKVGEAVSPDDDLVAE